MSDSRAKGYIGHSKWSWLLAAIGTMALIAALIYQFFFSESDDPIWLGIGVFGLGLIVAYFFLERQSIRKGSKSRGARYTLTASGLVFMMLAAMVTINVLGVRYDKRWDLTDNKQYTLSDQSRSILNALDAPVKVTAFFQMGAPNGESFEILMENAQAETTMIDFELIDPLHDPIKSEQFNIQSTYGTVILSQGDNERRLESAFGEEAFINSLVQLISGTKHTLCFTSGHGELDINDAYDPTGLGLFVEELQKQNYEAQSVTLLLEGELPEQCEVAILAGPQYDFKPEELRMLAEFVAQGKDLMVLLDPGYTPNLAKDLERYGIIVGDDLVLEQNPKYQVVGGDISYIILDQDSLVPHPILNIRNPMVMMRMARSVDADVEAEGVQTQFLATTTDQSWAEQGYDQEEMPVPDLGLERIGQVPIIAISEVTDVEKLYIGEPVEEKAQVFPDDPEMGEESDDPEMGEEPDDLEMGDEKANLPQEDTNEAPLDDTTALNENPSAWGNSLELSQEQTPDITKASGAKVLVFGSSSIALNSSFSGSPANLTVLLNSIAWMVGETAQINDRADDDAVPTIQANAIQVMLVWIICVLIAPGFLIIGALNTWRTRRAR